MGIILSLFIFQGIPVTYADTTWTMYGGTLENTHFQKMVGAMETIPHIMWSYVTGGLTESQGVAVTDVDGDGKTEVVVGNNDGKVYCFSGESGMLKWSYMTGGSVVSSPIIADVDGDGNMEVIVGSNDNKIYSLNGATGTFKWSCVTGGDVRSSPSVADVDGDGDIEVIVGSNDNKVYCLNGMHGAVKWSYVTGGDVRSSPVVAKVYGYMDVVIGSDDNKVYCLNGMNGVVEWSYMTGGNVASSPAIADVDGDSQLEVVVGSDDNKVYCLNGGNGTVEWSYTTGNEVCSSPAVADMNGDGVIEVIVGSDRYVYCLNGVTGALEWNYDAGSGGSIRDISVADIDGDISMECYLEVLVPTNYADTLICLNGEDGSILWRKGGVMNHVHSITIADIDDDGCVELVVGTMDDYKIWALDDIGNRSNCECYYGVEERSEKRKLRIESLEFRVGGSTCSHSPSLYLFTPNAISVDIKLYDICGRLQQTIYKGVLTKGGHTFIPNIKNSGIYFAVIQSHNFKKSLKIIRF